MGLFDIFGGKKGAGAFKKHSTRVANKRAQTPDRWESIRFLRELGTSEAAEALLQRFSYKVDPSISDRQEKDGVVEAIVAIGTDAALDPVCAYLAAADSIAWPMKVLNRLVTQERVIDELLSILSGMDVDYERFPEKKIQVIAELEERKDTRIAAAVAPFLGDINENARYHAVGALLVQEDGAEYVDAVADAFIKEEGARIRSFILDTMAAQGISFGARKPDVYDLLPQGYQIGADGVPSKK